MPETLNSILVLIIFMMPGFIASRVLGLAFPRHEQSQGHAVLEGIALSSLNYALFSWLIVIAWKSDWHRTPLLLAGLAFLILFVAPIVCALLVIKVMDSSVVRTVRKDFGLAHPVPKAWDYFFRQGRPCWVIVTLKDGRLVAGLYGNNSYASSFPAEEDIYLEGLCELTPEGRMSGLSRQSAGAIIRMENVQLLEFYEIQPK